MDPKIYNVKVLLLIPGIEALDPGEAARKVRVGIPDSMKKNIVETSIEEVPGEKPEEKPEEEKTPWQPI